MTTKQELMAATLELNFSDPFGGGTIPFVVATDGLTGQQAAAIPGERLNSVWAIVNHLTLVQDLFGSALRGELTEPMTPVTPETSSVAWPPLPEEICNETWQAVRQHALDTNHRLAETIVALSDEQMKEPIPNLFNLTHEQLIFGVMAQNTYHTAEIVTVRHMQGLWTEHQFA